MGYSPTSLPSLAASDSNVSTMQEHPNDFEPLDRANKGDLIVLVCIYLGHVIAFDWLLELLILLILVYFMQIQVKLESFRWKKAI